MYINIGKVVNTHGIKGEVRILSDIEYKDEIFKNGNSLYIGKEKTKMIINTYRVHKSFDMVTFGGINDINEVLKYKGDTVYIKKEEVNIDGYFDSELIDFDVYTNKSIGKLLSIRKNGTQKLLEIKGKKIYLVPKVDAFIKNIDFENKIIYINNIEGLIDEDWYFDFISKYVWWIFKWIYYKKSYR